MTQPSPFAFPNKQVYSWFFRVLPHLIICYLVWPEDSYDFPQTFVDEDLQLSCYIFRVFPGLTAIE
jgi:hypothetical protein